jgi:hypothetical protein
MDDLKPEHILVAVIVVVMLILVFNRCSSQDSFAAPPPSKRNRSSSEEIDLGILKEAGFDFQDCMERRDEYDCSMDALVKCYNYCMTHQWRCNSDPCTNAAIVVRNCNAKCKGMSGDARKDCIRSCIKI